MLLFIIVAYLLFPISNSIIQLLLLGALVGGFYALIATGLSLIFGVLKVINVAHGALCILAAYFCYWVWIFGADLILSMFFTMVLMLILGLALYLTIYRKAMKVGIDPSLFVSFGLSIALEALMSLLWGADIRGVQSSYIKLLNLGGISIPFMLLLDMTLATAVLCALYLFLKKTLVGKAIRACAQDWEAISLMGINVKFIQSVAFILAFAMIGISGSLLAATYAFDPFSGSIYLIRSLIVATLAGDKLIYLTFGGIMLGCGEVFVSYFFGGAYRNAATSFLFIMILLIRGLRSSR